MLDDLGKWSTLKPLKFIIYYPVLNIRYLLAKKFLNYTQDYANWTLSHLKKRLDLQTYLMTLKMCKSDALSDIKILLPEK